MKLDDSSSTGRTNCGADEGEILHVDWHVCKYSHAVNGGILLAGRLDSSVIVGCMRELQPAIMQSGAGEHGMQLANQKSRGKKSYRISM